MTRLSQAKTGTELIFISAGGGVGIVRRLTDMGLVPGEKIKVLHGFGQGQVIISIKGSKVALGYGLAQKISVRLA